MALTENPTLSDYTGFVQDSGEGRWTIQAAIDEAVPAEVLTAALYTRFRSRQEHTFAEKMLSAMRQKFGGHVEPKAKQQQSLAIKRRRSASRRQGEIVMAQPETAGAGLRTVRHREARRSLRHGDLRRGGRPDPAQADPRSLQPGEHQLLSREFAIVGVARNPMTTDEFRKKIR